MAPPKKQVDWKLLEELISIFCTGEECAAVLEMDYDTLNARIRERYGIGFSDYFKKHNLKGKASLRRRQYQLSEKNPALAIWLGKQYLDQVDSKEVQLPNADEYFKQIADAISQSDTKTN